MKRLGVILFLLIVVAGSVTSQQMAVVNRPANIPSFVGYVQNEFIVKFKSDVVNLAPKLTQHGTVAVGVADFDAVSENYGVSSIREQFPGSRKDQNAIQFGLPQYYKISFQTGTLDEVMASYRNNPMVEFVEPIAIHTTFATPNDGYYSSQWHLNRTNDADIDAPEAWDIQTGNSNIIVAIFDTGVRYFHKDLGGSGASYTTPTAADGNMWINTTEKNGVAGVDDDGNGYVDDWIGWDFVTGITSGCWSGEDCTTADNDPRDFNGHGTHCAGIVGAINNNAYATSSTAGGWNPGTQQTTGTGVKIMPCRIGYSGSYLGQEVGYVRMDFAASAFYYASAKGAKIASCSWGSSSSTTLAAAIDAFLAAGGMIFKAAGNDGTQTADYMCGRTDITSVAATDSNDCKADFSTYGTWVDISAPGTGILSLYHDHTNPSADYIAALDGTSMATPLAASVAALLWSKNTAWTATQVRDTLYATADNIYTKTCNSSYAGKLGAGRVNAYRAVNAGGTPCAVVAAFTGTPTSGCAPLTVAFTDQSTGSPTSWAWDFGDGGSSTLQSPSHQYTAAGTYTVKLTASSATCSNTITKTSYITVNTVPTAAFVGTPVSGNAPLTVSFTDQTTGGPTSWSWTFGDGGTSTLQNPSHLYTTAGTYSVSLTATNACGNNTFTRSSYITVTTAPAQQCDDFADGSITNWLNKTGTWTATGGYMKGNSATSNAQTTSPFGSFSTTTISCDVRMNTGRTGRNARIIFGYVDANNYRYVEGDDVANTWRIYERVSGKNTSRKSVTSTINTATWYTVQVVAAADGTVTMKVGGTTLGSYKFSAVKTGLVGCGYNKSNSDFDNFCVSATAGIVADNSSDYETIKPVTSVPSDFVLNQNFPNPFNPTTNISFSLPSASEVSLEIYNVLGQRVTTLVNGMMSAGTHTVTWNGKNESGQQASSGLYIYRLMAGDKTASRKMVLMK